MSIAFVAVTIVAAVMIGYSAFAVFSHTKWVEQALADYGVPRSWWPWLASAKATGAVGLLVGFVVPVIGVMAGIGLVLYFAGAVITVVHAHWYTHIAYPLLYLTPVIGALVLRYAA